jgi:hypothetical protein
MDLGIVPTLFEKYWSSPGTWHLVGNWGQSIRMCHEKSLEYNDTHLVSRRI